MSATAVYDVPAIFGRGFYDWIDPAAPTAGTAQSVTVDGAWFMYVLAARATVTTDSNAANRLVSMDYVNARGVTYVRNAASVVLTASTTNAAFEWNYQRTVAEWNTNTPFFLPCLATPLPPGFTVKFAIDSIQAGDATTGIHLFVYKVPTGIESGPQNAFPALPSF